MRKIKVVVLLVRQLQHGFTKNAKVSNFFDRYPYKGNGGNNKNREENEYYR